MSLKRIVNQFSQMTSRSSL